jgi:Lon protease-like protein
VTGPGEAPDIASDGDRNVIALFPLGHVLLPSMPLPLHVFEPRYRQLLTDVTARPGPTSFGVVALTKGIEVGTEGVEQEPEFASVGTLAEVLEVQPYEDGASDLFTVGSRRFRIERLIEGKPYLQAEVSYLDESDGALTPALRESVTRLEAEHARLITRLTGQVAGQVADSEAPGDDTQLSWRLAAQLPLTGADRQDLLEQPDTAARLARIATLLRREIALLRATGSIAVAPGVLQLYIRSN